MSFEEVIGVIKMMASSQGFYDRLYRTIVDMRENDPESFDSFVDEVESQNFDSALDLVMWLEC